MREIIRRSVEGIAIVVGLSVLFSFLGIYGTSNQPFWERMALWLTTIGTGGVASFVIIPLVFDRWLAKTHPAIKVIVAAALIAAPVTVSLVLFSLGYGQRIDRGAIIIQYGYVYVIALVITFAGYAIARMREGPPLPPDTGFDPVAAFLDRLPVKFRTAKLWALSSEDHYLRVYTDRGETMVLMRLADAERELADAEGLRVHRSWWIAKNAVTDARRDGPRAILILPSGGEVPVSRSYVAAAKEAGLVS